MYPIAFENCPNRIEDWQVGQRGGVCPDCGTPVFRHPRSAGVTGAGAGADVAITVEAFRQVIEQQLGPIRQELGPIRQELAVVRQEIVPIRTGLSYVLYTSLDPWEHIVSVDTNVAATRSTDYLDSVSSFYGTRKQHYCMFLGRATHCHIICSHIWPRHTCGEGLQVVNLERTCVDNPRNLLRLHKDLEKAFDHKRITFDLVPTADDEFKLQLRILDPSFRTEHISYNETTIQGGDLDNTLSDYTFRGEKRPYRRLLSLHMQKSVSYARERGWMPDQAFGEALRHRAVELARMSLEPERMAFIFPPDMA